MRVLIVKTTSLGDVIHTLPAVQDAYEAIPGIVFDWVVEAGFAQVPSWHPAVDQIFKSNVRLWRKNIFNPHYWREYAALKAQIKARDYDLVIDAQGLIKSAWIANFARGQHVGFDQSCVKEKLATRFYDQTIAVDPTAHAIDRVRQLFAKALGYSLNPEIRYGLNFQRKVSEQPSVMLLHGTTWPTKHYPAQQWRELAQLLNGQGIQILCAWGSHAEHDRATFICNGLKHARILPRMGITELAEVINQVSVVVAVDTGLAHLSAALDVPTVSLYGPTDPKRTGTRGKEQIHLTSTLPCSPCFKMDCKISDMTGPSDPPCLGRTSPGHIMGEVMSLLRARS